MRIAHAVGIPLWRTPAVLGPVLPAIPVAPIAAAALVNGAWEAIVVVLTFRPLRPRQAWGLAFVTTTPSAFGIVVDIWFGGRFVEVGEDGLMLNGVTAVGLARPAWWVAAALGVIEVLLFAAVAFALGKGGTGVFQGFLRIGTMSVAATGSRYLEDAERVQMYEFEGLA